MMDDKKFRPYKFVDELWDLIHSSNVKELSSGEISERKKKLVEELDKL